MGLREIEKTEGIISAWEENGLVIIKTVNGNIYNTKITRRRLEELKALNPAGVEATIAGMLDISK